MNTINNGKKIRTVVLLAGWLLALMAAPATVMGDCTETDNSEYSILVDASSSCGATSGNMHGCTTDSSGVCTILNPNGGDDIVIYVEPADAVGSIPAESAGLVSWTATGPEALGDGLVDLGILVGATGGGTCAWAYTPGAASDAGMAFQKSATRYQKVNDIFFCSDFKAPLPAEALVVMSKTVMPSGGTCGTDDVEVLEINAGDYVEYCFVIKNIGLGDAGTVILSDPDAFAADQLLGNIDAGELIPTKITSDPVVIAETGEIINTATVTWENAEVPGPTTGTVSDTATVISTTAVEACPDQYKELVDGTIGAGVEDDFGFAALFDPKAPSRVSLCAKGGSAGTECIEECIVKTECIPDPLEPTYGPNNPACTAPNYQCEPSGAWSYKDTDGICQIGTEGTPYCWELAADRGKVCNYQPVQVMKKHLLVIEQIHVNPWCFFITTNIDGKSTTVQHCF